MIMDYYGIKMFLKSEFYKWKNEKKMKNIYQLIKLFSKQKNVLVRYINKMNMSQKNNKQFVNFNIQNDQWSSQNYCHL
jgi:hypothetical protein